MPTLVLEDLRRAAHHRQIPNADALDFQQLLRALANQTEYMSRLAKEDKSTLTLKRETLLLAGARS
ncbi:MAG: hypothetical protein QNJ46_34510 [Leptolyngbyaceae cyanobacterium MO_188.B28]|nr:hypothetical protein [Leptolyngbyaceae cyanobacterium MO_188.B28]